MKTTLRAERDTNRSFIDFSSIKIYGRLVRLPSSPMHRFFGNNLPSIADTPPGDSISAHEITGNYGNDAF
jgi:hypothetical protein